MIHAGAAQVPWFMADGTDVKWHPSTSPFGGKTSTQASSFFATATAQIGKPMPGATVWIQLAEVPVSSPLPVLCKVFNTDESTLIAQKVLGTNAGLFTFFGPIAIPPSTYVAASANVGGFCVKLYDHTAGAVLTLDTYKVMVWWTPVAAPTNA